MRMPLKLNDYLVNVFEAPPGERCKKEIYEILPLVVMKTSCLKSLEKGMYSFYIYIFAASL